MPDNNKLALKEETSPMSIKLTSTRKDRLGNYFDIYLKSLCSPIDSFLEGHILRSKYFNIELDGNVIGYTAIHKKSLLSQFFIIDEHKSISQEVYFQIKRLSEVTKIFVPTCDEFFLSHAIESNRGVEIQAYFFQDHKKQIESQKDLENFDLVIANECDISFIKEKSGDFFDDLEKSILSKEIFIGLNKGEKVSFGILEVSKLLGEYASIGMFVIEEKRQQGFGVKTLLRLKHCCYDMEINPIAGCWYYNHNSKKTLEKAGMYTKTRLLNIQL
jgi:thymidine kinase